MKRIILIMVSTCLAAAVFAAEKRPVTLDDGERIKSPRSPVVSPDGRSVVFVLEGEIHIASPSTDAPRLLTSAGSAWAPRWSGDGNSLYFVSDRNHQAQVWKLPVSDFGEAVQVTRFSKGIRSTNLSPDENRILLTLTGRDLADAPDADALAEPFVVTRRQFKRDAGGGYLTAEDARHVYVYDIGDDELVRLTDGNFDEGQPTWSPDGGSVAFVSNREAEPDATYRSDIWTVSASPAGDRTLTRLTNNKDQKYSPAFSPDGRQVAYLTAGDGVYSVPHIAVVPAIGGESRVLTASLDRWIGQFEFSDDGRWIYFSYDNAGGTELARVRVADGRIERLLEGEISVRGFDVGNGTTVAINLGGRNDGVDVHLMRGRRLQKLTDLNAEFFNEILVGEKRKVAFESSDGTPVEAFLTLPPGYEEGERYPAILNIHGGPVGQFSWGYGFRAQYFAANGYVVIEPNPRGSTGFGEDFIRAIYRTWGITDYDDVIASVDHAIEAGIADPDRLAVTGYSYGGYMTNVVITGTTRFRAAASGAGHSLIEANFGHDIYQQWYMWELGYPWENREKYDVLSPFLRVGNVETPTIFLGGRIDWNVPILNAELMYQALEVRGIDAELVVYPDVHHGGWPTEYENDYQERVIAWFDRYVKD